MSYLGFEIWVWINNDNFLSFFTILGHSAQVVYFMVFFYVIFQAQQTMTIQNIVKIHPSSPYTGLDHEKHKERQICDMIQWWQICIIE